MKKRNTELAVGAAMLAVILFFTLLGIFWTPYDPDTMSSKEKFSPPGISHLMGTDNFGRDILSRVMWR